MIFAEIPNWDWAISSENNISADVSNSIVSDSEGNTYITGYFWGSMSLGEHTVTSNGQNDIFIAKIDSTGNYIWAVNAGGDIDDSGENIIIDENGDIYVTGSFKGIAYFGSYILNSDGGSDIFIAKLDTNGNWVWVNRAGGGDDDTGLSMTLGLANGLWVTGYFKDVADFGSYNLNSSGLSDIFICRLRVSDGFWYSASSAGGPGYDSASSITSNSTGIFITGSFNAYANFGSHNLNNNNLNSVFVAKYSYNGYWDWASTTVGNYQRVIGKSIISDSQGNFYIAGHFEGIVSFGDTSIESNGGNDCFLAKINYDGNWLWATSPECSNHDFGCNIIQDSENNIYLTGYFNGTIIFGNNTISSNNADNIFLAKLDSNLNWEWVCNSNSDSNLYTMGLCIDISQNIYLTGCFTGNTTFGYTSLSNAGSNDLFVAKVKTIPPLVISGQDQLSTQEEMPITIYLDNLVVDDPLNNYPNDFELIIQNGDNYTTSGNTITPEMDFSGILEIPIKIRNTVNQIESSLFELEVSVENINDTPIISLPIPDFSIYEDTVNCSINLNNVFYDSDSPYGDLLTYSYSGNSNIDIEIELGEVSLTPISNWNGLEIINFTATDNSGESITDEVVITVLNTNDSPNVNWILPEETTISLTVGTEISFAVSADDTDSELCYEWFIGSENLTNNESFLTYNFESSGNFEIKSIVSDEEFSIETIWNISISNTSNENDIGNPYSNKLLGNYPNPFNPITKISYTLESNGFIEIKLYNSKGQFIRSLVSENQKSGYYSITWDSVDHSNIPVSSGLYFYKLDINGKTHSIRKCILLK
jgi:flagellar hook assembly protein FlgD